MGDRDPVDCSEIHVDIRSPEESKRFSGGIFGKQDHPQVVENMELGFLCSTIGRPTDHWNPLPCASMWITGNGFCVYVWYARGAIQYEIPTFAP